jgi:hypothetical protein
MTENEYKRKELNFTRSLERSKEGDIYYKSGVKNTDLSWGNPLKIIKYFGEPLIDILAEHKNLLQSHKLLQEEVLSQRKMIERLEKRVNDLELFNLD